MSRPLLLTLCLTHDCTLRCRYCYAGRKYARAMSRETADRGIELGLEEAARTSGRLDIAFFGGEPLMEWELLQHCHEYLAAEAAARNIPVRYGITTNGTLLSQDRLEWMAERDYLIGLSLDGSPTMHDTNRRFADGRGSHATVWEALERINSFPKLRSKVICVVNPANHHYLREGVRWLHEHYKGDIGLNFDYWSEWTDAQFESLTQELEGMVSDITDSYRVGQPMRVEAIDGKIRSHLYAGKEFCNHCRIGEQEIAVSVDGKLFPCSRMVGVGDEPEITFGDVRSGIDRAKQHYYIATRGNATPECRICTLRHRCTNTCGCTNYAGTGTINHVSPFLCNLQQTLIRLADSMAETLYQEKNSVFMDKFYCGFAPPAD
ncbi:MAG: radical SAM protein [Akkermansia sp.]|nr:radical SAM protein [Akkermansia sp.]